MQNDDVTWSIIGKSFCSYKVTFNKEKLCRNEYNVTGLCCKKACPLANSQYATIREEKGRCFLYMRTVERCMFPSQQWEKVKLSTNVKEARQQIKENLIYWDHYFQHKCKQRLIKIAKYLHRMRKIKLKGEKKLIEKRTNVERRYRKREKKALVAAKLDDVIEKKLLERLKEGTYDRIHNFPREAFRVRTEEGITDKRMESYEVEHSDEEIQNAERKKVVKVLEREAESSDYDTSDPSDFDADSDDFDDDSFSSDSEDVDSDDDTPDRQFVADFSESEDEISDIEDLPGPSKKKMRK